MYISTKKGQTPYTETDVRKYMERCLDDNKHIDWVYGSVNSTLLAEDACQHFDAYGPEPTCACPAEFFELAFQVGEAFEEALDEEEGEVA